MAIAGGDPVLLLFLAVFGAVGVVAALHGAAGLVVWRRLRAREPTASYDVRTGPVELDGRAAVFEETVPAPFAEGVRTLAYEYRVERYEYDDDGSDWETVDSGTVGVPFVVTVDGLDVVVDPEGADLLLGEETRIELEADEAPTGALADFVAGNDRVDHSGETVDVGPLSFGGSRHRFSVSRLDPGERVYVTGHLVQAYDARLRTHDQQYVVEKQQRSLPERLRLPTPFLIADAGEAVAQRRVRNEALVALGVGLVFGGVAAAVVLLAG